MNEIDNASACQLPFLETFAKAAEVSSFTDAAKALGITQAAVSQRIHVLEQVLKVSLFHRQAGGIRLTDAGQELYPYAERILALHAEAVHRVTGRKTTVSGDLEIAASSVPGEHLLPVLLRDFRRRYPEVRVRVNVTDSMGVLRDLEKGRGHVGFVGRKVEGSLLDFRPFAKDEIVVVVPANHAWVPSRRVSWKRFVREPLVLREQGSGSRWCFEHALETQGRSLADLRVAMELGSNEAIKEAILQGLGVTVLSRHAVDKEVKGKQLHALHLSGVKLQRDLFLVQPTRRALPLAARVFLRLCQSEGNAQRVGDVVLGAS